MSCVRPLCFFAHSPEEFREPQATAAWWQQQRLHHGFPAQVHAPPQLPMPTAVLPGGLGGGGGGAELLQQGGMGMVQMMLGGINTGARSTVVNGAFPPDPQQLQAMQMQLLMQQAASNSNALFQQQAMSAAPMAQQQQQVFETTGGMQLMMTGGGQVQATYASLPMGFTPMQLQPGRHSVQQQACAYAMPVGAAAAPVVSQMPGFSPKQMAAALAPPAAAPAGQQAVAAAELATALGSLKLGQDAAAGGDEQRRSSGSGHGSEAERGLQPFGSHSKESPPAVATTAA